MELNKLLNTKNDPISEETWEQLNKVFKRIDKIFSKKIKEMDNNFCSLKLKVQDLTTKLIDEICKYNEIPFEKVEYDLDIALQKYLKVVDELFKFGKSDLEGQCNNCKRFILNELIGGSSLETAYKKYVQEELDEETKMLFKTNSDYYLCRRTEII